jgi:RNA polymerase sigma-70 factor, ECF subfamily
LCQYAHRFTGRPDIAEDIVQETFLNIWKGRSGKDIHGSLHSYLFAAVRNGAMNYLKRLIIERKYTAITARQIQTAVNYLQITREDGSSLLIAEEMEKSMENALDKLAPRCREIFVLSRKEGMKHSEIADRLKISQNTVHRQISIAIDKLYVKLAHLLKS